LSYRSNFSLESASPTAADVKKPDLTVACGSLCANKRLNKM
jgi:hypothetical protein